MFACARSMRDVVRCLVGGRSEALRELEELQSAVQEMLYSLVELERVVSSLASDVARVRSSSAVRVPIVIAVHQRVTLINELTGQVVAAFRELAEGVSDWQLNREGPAGPNGAA